MCRRTVSLNAKIFGSWTALSDLFVTEIASAESFSCAFAAVQSRPLLAKRLLEYNIGAVNANDRAAQLILGGAHNPSAEAI